MILSFLVFIACLAIHCINYEDGPPTDFKEIWAITTTITFFVWLYHVVQHIRETDPDHRNDLFI